MSTEDHRVPDHRVHEAVGPSLTWVETAGALGVGVNSLLVLGVLPVLLGALVDEHRLTNPDIGLVATVEVLTMGVATALAGILLKPQRLKTIGLAATLVLAVVDYATAGASGAGVFFTGQTLSQLLLALALAAWIMPRWGATGGFVAIAVCALAGAGAAPIGPSKLADLDPGEAIGGAPPLRGWIALIGTLIYVSGAGAVGVYLEPLALQAGLDPGVARTALWVSLAAQVVGSATATALAGRIRWFAVFLVTTTAYLCAWWTMGQHAPAWLFIGANAAAGIFGLFLSPFLVPMTIEADPSRRAAVQSGAAQLIGGAMGPLLASRVVGEGNVHGALWLGAALTLVGLAVVAWLHFTHGRRRVPAAEAA